MSNVTIEEAQIKLNEIIHGLAPGEEVVVTENNRPVARIVSAAAMPSRRPRRPGTLRGTVVYMAPDFDAPLEDFEDYME